ncbi:response regulator transcription factor [Alkalicoccobacillus porphyridii]|nr:response regulator transcription factor [Alkalicoccobacillus porphyridii]
MLIVDDEPVICQGLAQTILWESIGVEVVGVAFNGKQALQKIEEHQVDLVLTDVSMPVMDGLELAACVAQQLSETKLIIISGFDEFDYARTALRLGVEDYLLKPVDVDELMTLVQSVSKRIAAKKKEIIQDEHKTMENLLFDAVFRTPSSKDIFLELTDRYAAHRMIVCELPGYSQETNLWTKQVEAVFEQISPTYGIHYVSLGGHENEWVLFLYGDSMQELSDHQLAIIWEEVSGRLDFPLQAVVSETSETAANCHKQYQQSLELLDQLRGHGEGLYFFGAEVSSSEAPYPKAAEDCLLEAIIKQDEIKIRACINEMIATFADSGYSLSQTVHVCRELELVLKRKLQERLPNKPFDHLNLHLHKEVDLRIMNTFEVIEEIVVRDMIGFLGEVELTEQQHWVIENIRRYIHKHYQQDLRASEVAEKHFITPNYFSMLFKQETGKSFSEYLNGLRINQASELLLSTSNKVFEIAEYVGYKEYKYFVQVFKKHVGLTPTHYRRLNASHDTRKKQI